MTERLPQVKAKELVRVLERLGFIVRRQTGSHCILKNQESGKMVSVPMHNGDIKRGLLFGILKQAGIEAKEFLDNV